MKLNADCFPAGSICSANVGSRKGFECEEISGCCFGDEILTFEKPPAPIFYYLQTHFFEEIKCAADMGFLSTWHQPVGPLMVTVCHPRERARTLFCVTVFQLKLSFKEKEYN